MNWLLAPRHSLLGLIVFAMAMVLTVGAGASLLTTAVVILPLALAVGLIEIAFKPRPPPTENTYMAVFEGQRHDEAQTVTGRAFIQLPPDVLCPSGIKALEAVFGRDNGLEDVTITFLTRIHSDAKPDPRVTKL